MQIQQSPNLVCLKHKGKNVVCFISVYLVIKNHISHSLYGFRMAGHCIGADHGPSLNLTFTLVLWMCLYSYGAKQTIKREFRTRHPLRDPKLVEKKHIRQAFEFYISIYLRGQKWKKWNISRKSPKNNDVFCKNKVFLQFFNSKNTMHLK